MAKKILKTRVQFTSTLKTELYEQLKAMSDKTQIPISRLLDMAVEEMLRENTSKE